MRESRTSGFVRGAHSNMCPYRDPDFPLELHRGIRLKQQARFSLLNRWY
jgi:hypothetical protein